jgi:hypothetical protein
LTYRLRFANTQARGESREHMIAYLPRAVL